MYHLMAPPRRWTTADRLPNDRLRRFPDVSPLVIQLLANRGVTEDDEVRAFLDGAAGTTHDPNLLKGIAEAIARIRKAIEHGELIAVHGDFDADGVTATALLTEVLRALGAQVLPVIPKREEGYGLNLSTFGTLANQGVSLVVTVDCGISSAREIVAARELGLDVVVTDHHRVTSDLPMAATAIVNPRQPGCEYPFKSLAGVGVAFKLAQALLGAFEDVSGRLASGHPAAEIEQSVLDLVALGTVADVVPLLGENRVLASRGLVELNRTSRPGLRELIRVAGLQPDRLDSWAISYTIGPRLNAAGRLGDARISFDLLTGSAGEAPALARKLEDINRERQIITEEMLEDARRKIAGQAESKLLFVASEDYPHGILGLVAGRLTDEFYRPAFVLKIDSDEARASVRSIAEFDVAAALADCRDLLTRYGGHARAAGFTVPLANLDELRERLFGLAESQLANVDLEPTLRVDAELDLRKVKWRVHEDLQRIGPFGYDNPTPLFLSRGLRVIHSRVVGQHAPGHLRLTVSDGINRWPAIGFGYGASAASLPEIIDLVYQIEPDTWTGGQALQLRIRGLQPSEQSDRQVTFQVSAPPAALPARGEVE